MSSLNKFKGWLVGNLTYDVCFVARHAWGTCLTIIHVMLQEVAELNLFKRTNILCT